MVHATSKLLLLLLPLLLSTATSLPFKPSRHLPPLHLHNSKLRSGALPTPQYQNQNQNYNTYKPNSNPSPSFQNLQPQSPSQQPSSSPLLQVASRTSLTTLFFILTWRTIHHYELISQSPTNASLIYNKGVFSALFRLIKGCLRFVRFMVLVAVFFGNIWGFCTTLLVINPSSSSSSSSNLDDRQRQGQDQGISGLKKTRLKTIINVNKVIEFILLLSNLYSLVLPPSPPLPSNNRNGNKQYGYTPQTRGDLNNSRNGKGVVVEGRDVFFGRIIVNIVYLMFCTGGTRVSFLGYEKVDDGGGQGQGRGYGYGGDVGGGGYGGGNREVERNGSYNNFSNNNDNGNGYSNNANNNNRAYQNNANNDAYNYNER